MKETIVLLSSDGEQATVTCVLAAVQDYLTKMRCVVSACCPSPWLVSLWMARSCSC